MQIDFTLSGTFTLRHPNTDLGLSDSATRDHNYTQNDPKKGADRQWEPQAIDGLVFG